MAHLQESSHAAIVLARHEEAELRGAPQSAGGDARLAALAAELLAAEQMMAAAMLAHDDHIKAHAAIRGFKRKLEARFS